MSTIAGFYRYAAEEGIIEHSPAVHVRRPRLDYGSHAVGLDRNELGAFLVAAGLASPQDHALASLLALNGLRISEALGANIEDIGVERGHRTLLVHRKGGKTVTIPLAPRTARAVDLAIADRLDGPIFLDSLGRRLRRDAAARMVRRLAKRAGITKRIGPHSLRHSFITATLACPCAMSKKRPRMPTLDHDALRPRSSVPTGMQHTSSPPSSPGPPAATLEPTTTARKTRSADQPPALRTS